MTWRIKDMCKSNPCARSSPSIVTSKIVYANQQWHFTSCSKICNICSHHHAPTTPQLTRSLTLFTLTSAASKRSTSKASSFVIASSNSCYARHTKHKVYLSDWKTSFDMCVQNNKHDQLCAPYLFLLCKVIHLNFFQNSHASPLYGVDTGVFRNEF